jgi:hypothetical protein
LPFLLTAYPTWVKVSPLVTASIAAATTAGATGATTADAITLALARASRLRIAVGVCERTLDIKILLCVFKNIAEPFRNMYTILQTQILVNLFLVLSVSFVDFLAFHNFSPKRTVGVVQLNSSTLWRFKL